MEDRVRRLERENETLKALLLLNNVKVTFEDHARDETEEMVTTFKGDPSTLSELAALRDQVKQMRTLYLLVRADACVLKEQLEVTLNELARLTSK